MRHGASDLESRILAGYFALQALVGVAFWIAVLGSNVGHRVFELEPGRDLATDAFVGADLVAVTASLVSAVALWRGSRWAVAAVAFVTGCIVYPTVYLLWWAPTSAGAARCLVIMLPPAVIGSWITVRLARSVLGGAGVTDRGGTS